MNIDHNFISLRKSIIKVNENPAALPQQQCVRAIQFTNYRAVLLGGFISNIILKCPVLIDTPEEGAQICLASFSYKLHFGRVLLHCIFPHSRSLLLNDVTRFARLTMPVVYNRVKLIYFFFTKRPSYSFLDNLLCCPLVRERRTVNDRCVIVDCGGCGCCGLKWIKYVYK
jgi:hypothetical protein